MQQEVVEVGRQRALVVEVDDLRDAAGHVHHGVLQLASVQSLVATA